MDLAIVLIKAHCRVTVLSMLISFITMAGVQTAVAQQRSTRQSSIEAFSKGNFDQALNGFRELLATYPKDPLYKYYSGVCLIKLGREPEEAYNLLQQALQGSAVVRSIPDDGLFWLGRSQQITGRFTDAIESYNEFTELYGRKAARDLGIPGYLQQCSDRKGNVSEVVPKAPASGIRLNSPENIPEAVAEKVAEPEKNYVRNQDTVPAGFDLILSEALEYQFLADSIARVAEGLASGLDKLDYRSKTVVRARIAEAEKLSASYQKLADQKYNEAQASMNADSFSRVKLAVKEQKADNAATKEAAPAPALPKTPVVVAVVKKDSMQAATEDLFSVFAVKPPESVSGNKVPLNATIPPGLIYRIQVAVFKNPVTLSYFKGLTPVYGFRAAGTESTAYYAGLFRRIADARKALLTVRQKGFRDAFIVAFSAGKQISLERAALLEKEWGKKPFVTAQQAKPQLTDTIPPELCFRVEVMRSVKPVKPGILEEMKNIAGAKGLESEPQAKGTTVYLIGKFITYESASQYADLLVRNGYRDAKVVARLGKKEVPVETAKQLFEKVE